MITQYIRAGRSSTHAGICKHDKNRYDRYGNLVKLGKGTTEEYIILNRRTGASEEMAKFVGFVDIYRIHIQRLDSNTARVPDNYCSLCPYSFLHLANPFNTVFNACTNCTNCTRPSLSGYLFGDFPLRSLRATAGRNNHSPAASPAFWRVQQRQKITATTTTPPHHHHQPPAAIITTRWGIGNSSLSSFFSFLVAEHVERYLLVLILLY